MKNILLISDLAGVGKVALSAMIPILSQKGFNLNYLPTAVVSNNFAYGDAVVHDLTPFMEETLQMWRKHQFQFDLITTGFLMNQRQAEIIQAIIQDQKKRPLVITDPIMGDNGSIYLGMSDDLVAGMQMIAPQADLIMPNLTEAALLLNRTLPEAGMTHPLIVEWIEALRQMGSRAIVITSVTIDQRHFVYGYDPNSEEIFREEYSLIPIDFGGTGDLFSSLMTAQMIRQVPLQLAVAKTVALLSQILNIEAKKEHPDGVAQVDLENYLPLLHSL